MSAADLTDPGTLRALLVRLHELPSLWNGSEAHELLLMCRARYAALARKHGQTPDDAMRIAFEQLRAAGVRWARDPWGSLTTAMRIALATSSLEDALMCSRDQASHLLKTHSPRDVARLGEHEHLARYVENRTAHSPGPATSGRAFEAAERLVDDAVRTLVICGWPTQVASQAVGLVTSRLIEAEDRRRAHEYLRHDHETPLLLGVPHSSWCALVTALLGSPATTTEHTAAGRGILWRLAAGTSVDELLTDARVVEPLIAAAPSQPPATSNPDREEAASHV
ncbi:hypothetical protein ET495_10070 [Xylanimonas allomyrinae]|uniref:Serine/arginine repetitive matrix protein 2 n=1 Tax=Xylanimonas allomyrinae TaxID=2509459 RepID=A0A4P6EMI4_9MICO|nr:hypothetical protein [Xylanimonas allomyrinae]QAY63536.1 hypothetical protein ET495_10070 [Xylanimonas allomyrinae]